MNLPAILALYTQGHRIDIEYPDMRKETSPYVVRFIRPAPGMSVVHYSRLDADNADAVIRAQVDDFRRLNQPFSWKVFDGDQPPDLAERLVAHGFTPDFDPDDAGPVMVLDLAHAPPSLLAPITADVRQVETTDGLEDVITVMEGVWGGKFGWMRERLGRHLAIPGYLNLYVAYVDEQPACAGWTYVYPHSQFAGLFGGSTLPAYRGRGLYTAVLAARVQAARRRGLDFLVVETSAMSQPIVARHGFQLLTHALDYVWRPQAST